jgi:hypothetical protein
VLSANAEKLHSKYRPIPCNCTKEKYARQKHCCCQQSKHSGATHCTHAGAGTHLALLSKGLHPQQHKAQGQTLQHEQPVCSCVACELGVCAVSSTDGAVQRQ